MTKNPSASNLAGKKPPVLLNELPGLGSIVQGFFSMGKQV
jgi:hypothetical protein